MMQSEVGKYTIDKYIPDWRSKYSSILMQLKFPMDAKPGTPDVLHVPTYTTNN